MVFKSKYWLLILLIINIKLLGLIYYCPDGSLEYSTSFIPRSQANSIAYFNPYIYDCCGFMEDCYSIWTGFRFTQSFRDENINSTLFGPGKQEVVDFSGVKAPEKKRLDFRGDDFGLSPNALESMFLDTKIRNYIWDLSFHLNLGQISPYLDCSYLKINSSLVRTVWGLNSKVLSKESAEKNYGSFPAGYMSDSFVPAAKDLKTALSGKFLMGDMQTPWKYGRFDLKKNTKIGLANIDLILGRDVLRFDYYHLGAFLKLGIPTGNRPDAKYFFQSIVGNGHHWELGGGLDWHYNILNCDDKCVQFYINGNVVHLYKDKQYRSFDLLASYSDGFFFKSGIFSRYLLLQEFDNNKEYRKNLINGINLLTKKVESSFNIQADLSGQLILRKSNWTCGFGYNFYYRSAEKIKVKDKFFDYDQINKYGIKGGSGVFAHLWETWQTNPDYGKVLSKIYSLSSTQSLIRLYNTEGTYDSRYVDNLIYVQPPVTSIPDAGNPTAPQGINWDQLNQPPYGPTNVPYPPADSLGMVDKDGNPIDIPRDANGALDYTATVALMTGPKKARFVQDPVILTDEDINLCSVAMPKQISHKFFGYFSYQWEDDCCYCPYIGFGGEIEVAQKCRNATLSQWGVWLKFGLNF